MDNTVTIQLFLLSCAVPVALEAYKASKPAGWALWTIAGAFLSLGFAFPWLITKTPVASQNIAAMVGSPASWFTLAVALFFVARPFWSNTIPAAKVSVYDDTALRSEVASLAKTVRAVIDDYQRMSGLEARVDQDIEQIRANAKSEAADKDAFQLSMAEKIAGLQSLAEKIESVRVEAAIANQNISKNTAANKLDKERTLGSLYAIGARETLKSLEDEIHRDASDLYDCLKNGEIYDAQKWLQWENIYAHFKQTLEKWLSAGTWYALSVKERTLTVDENLYGAEWSVEESQFPNAEAVRKFKKFRIIYNNWNEVLPNVRSGLDRVAFSGMSEEDVRSGRPAG